MNSAQILRQALFEADAVRRDGTTHPSFTQVELLTIANRGKDEIERALRQNEQDFQLLVVQSNDVAFRWSGITYNPTAFRLLTTTKRYALPPDCLELKRIRAITAGEEGTEFIHLDMSHTDFKDAENAGTSASTDPILWDVVGENTLYLANVPSTTLDIEIAYIGRSEPLQIYTQGTVTTVLASANVAGGGTAWVANEVSLPCDLIIPDAVGNTPKVVSQTAGGYWVDPSIHYYPVDSIDTDGGLTLAGTWLRAGIVGSAYMLASTPNIPPDAHQLLVDYVVARALRGSRPPLSGVAEAAFDKGVTRMLTDTKQRQQHSIEVVEDFDLDA
jgi:hypothetical protein